MSPTESFDLEAIVGSLRQRRSDITEVEAKAATDGLPETLDSTLCAFANRPTGGLVLLGIDENKNFASVPLYDEPHVIAEQIANKVRQRFLPPIVVEIIETTFERNPVIAIIITPIPPDQRPCKVKKTGVAYIRINDGDYPISPQEEQGFLVARNAPNVDIQPVAGAIFSDLDEELVEEWCDTVKKNDPQGLGSRNTDDMLFYGGICTRDHTPTVAGILALGIYPQRFFPSAVIRAASMDPALPVRATYDAVIAGPIGSMISQALTWAERAFRSVIAQTPDGHTVNRKEYPLAAFREIISNALIHRDYAPWAHGIATEVRLLPDQLTAYNPGGLYGITKNQLGMRLISSARNPQLLSICRYLTLAHNDQRIVETLAQGIPLISHELSQAGLLPAIFDDTGIGFTVRLRNYRALTHAPSPPWQSQPEQHQRLLTALSQSASESTVTDLARQLGIHDMQVRRIMKDLIADELVVAKKKPGQRALLYRLRESTG